MKKRPWMTVPSSYMEKDTIKHVKRFWSIQIVQYSPEGAVYVYRDEIFMNPITLEIASLYAIMNDNDEVLSVETVYEKSRDIDDTRQMAGKLVDKLLARNRSHNKVSIYDLKGVY